MEIPDLERFTGCLFGLATGDALGTTVEFSPPGSFAPVRDMVGGGPFGLDPGQWTDDTSMALCLAESLVECRGFDPADQMRRYVRWWRQGHLSSTGRCGRRLPLLRRPDLRCPAGGDQGDGVGRALLPYCRVLGRPAAGPRRGGGRRRLVQAQAAPAVQGTGYVVDCLEAALWAFHRGRAFDEGCLLAVNLGNDADTTGAVYGQLAGAYYGIRGIPKSWREKIALGAVIAALAEKLYRHE
jgi:ADP-ribosyl-[dinitrogen reductase] hydrolase